ncbi:MAG: hypothetical protein ACREM1_19165, partial [Longimicrobiales bacterium]
MTVAKLETGNRELGTGNHGIAAAPPAEERLADILSADTLAFVAELHGRFGERRNQLLRARAEREPPSGFLEETRDIREADWRVAPPRADNNNRRVEITGPTDR